MAIQHPDPIVSPRQSVAETTVLSVGLGLVLAVVMASANVYLGLYVGMTVSASIPAAVVSMAVLRGVFRRGTILENNIAQTIASTGESLAAGAIFTIPAIVLVGAWKNFEFWPTTLIVMLGGLLGVIFMVPLRRALIVDRPDLIYPEGVACSEVLSAGQSGGSGIKYIGLGLLIGGAFKYLVSGLKAVVSTLEGAVASGKSVFYAGSDLSMALLAVGYIVRMNIAIQVFLGGFIGWVICIPVFQGFEGDDPLGYAWDMWDTQVRYVGVGTMLVGGLFSIWTVRGGVFSALGSLVGVSKAGEASRTERDMPMIALVTLFLGTAAGTVALYNQLIGDIIPALAAGAVMIVASFIFVAVATYIVGLVGSSNSPVSGMTICTVLLTAAVLLGLGISGESAILATLGVAGVVCCAACTSGDIAQDLKTGLLVGATPWKQQWTEVLGVVVPAFCMAPVMALLHDQYVIGEGLRAPQATLFASLAEGFFGDGSLPWNRIILGVGIGLIILITDAIFSRAKHGARLHIMPIAVGMYLPFSLSIPIALGGLVRIAADAAKPPTSDARDTGVLYGSGLIAGEALMGIGLAFPAALGITLYTVTASAWLSATAFALAIMLYVFIARRSEGS